MEIDMPKPLRVSPPETSATSEVQVPRTKGRRQFSVAEKQRILHAADGRSHDGLGALLRKARNLSFPASGLARTTGQVRKRWLEPKALRISPEAGCQGSRDSGLNTKLKKLTRELGIVNGLVELQKKAQALIAAMREEEPPSSAQRIEWAHPRRRVLWSREGDHRGQASGTRSCLQPPSRTLRQRPAKSQSAPADRVDQFPSRSQS